MTRERDAEFQQSIEALQTARRSLDKRVAVVERATEDIATQQAAIDAERDRLFADRTSFNCERQTFAEEVVRMHTINKFQER